MNETTFIEKLKTLSKDKTVSLNFTDDTAILNNFLITKDILIENIHFILKNNIEAILFKAITANVSDICAMGGIAKYIILGIGLPDYIKEDEFVSSLKKTLDFYNLDLIGGDTSSSSQFFISITAIGERNKYLLKRDGAKPGDLIFLSREIGAAKYYLDKELKGESITKHYYLTAETQLGNYLGKLDYITSCTDLSDGLGVDANSIAMASNVRLIIDKEKVPIFEKSTFENALQSGEEFALLFTAKKEHASKLIKNAPTQIYQIGRVTSGNGVFLNTENKLKNISNFGFIHKSKPD